MAKPTSAPAPRDRKPPKLTPRQENFARHVVMGYSQSYAYRAAYNVRPGTTANSVHVNASKTMANINVSLRVAELRAEAARLAVVTNASILAEMDQNRTMAIDSGKLSVAQSASRDRARVAGVIHQGLGGINGRRDSSQEAVENGTTPEERSINDIARRIAFALAKGKHEARKAKALPKPE